MLKKYFFAILPVLLILPAITFAVGFADPVAVPTLTQFILTVLGIMWKVFVGIAIVFFVLAGIMFLTAMGEPAKITQAKQFVIWGVVGVVVAILAYSIVAIIGNALLQP